MVARFVSVLLAVVIPGGLVVLAAWTLARLVHARMQADQGPQGQRLARAFATVQLRDVVREARRML